MKKGISYIEVIISITIITICFIPLINMLYLSTSIDKSSKEIYIAELLSKNLIVEIENNLLKVIDDMEYLQLSAVDELTNNENFEAEYMLDRFDFYVNIQTWDGSQYKYKTNEIIGDEIDINSEILATNDVFDVTYDNNYDIILKVDNGIEIIKGADLIDIEEGIHIKNSEDYTRVCIYSEVYEDIKIISATNNEIFLHVIGKINLKQSFNGKVVYTEKLYKNQSYIVSVFVYDRNKILRANNMKVIYK